MVLLITGGAGFIGSNLVHYAIRHSPHRIVVVDKLTYAGTLRNLEGVVNDPRYAASKASSDHFVRAYAHTYGLPVLITNCSNNSGRGSFRRN